MKQLLFILFSVLTLSSCDSNTSGSPEESLSGFIDCMKRKDYQAAKAYTNNNTDAILDFMETRKQILNDIKQKEVKESIWGQLDFNTLEYKCTTNGTEAICNCCLINTDKCSEIRIEKQSGKWLIDLPKESSSVHK